MKHREAISSPPHPPKPRAECAADIEASSVCSRERGETRPIRREQHEMECGTIASVAESQMQMK